MRPPTSYAWKVPLPGKNLGVSKTKLTLFFSTLMLISKTQIKYVVILHLTLIAVRAITVIYVKFWKQVYLMMITHVSLGSAIDRAENW